VHKTLLFIKTKQKGTLFKAFLPNLWKNGLMG